MMTKKLPVGIESFEEIRKQDFYYVDKTDLISDLSTALRQNAQYEYA